jgi:hypothetical protein
LILVDSAKSSRLSCFILPTFSADDGLRFFPLLSSSSSLLSLLLLLLLLLELDSDSDLRSTLTVTFIFFFFFFFFFSFFLSFLVFTEETKQTIASIDLHVQ